MPESLCEWPCSARSAIIGCYTRDEAVGVRKSLVIWPIIVYDRLTVPSGALQAVLVIASVTTHIHSLVAIDLHGTSEFSDARRKTSLKESSSFEYLAFCQVAGGRAVRIDRDLVGILIEVRFVVGNGLRDLWSHSDRSDRSMLRGRVQFLSSIHWRKSGRCQSVWAQETRSLRTKLVHREQP